MEILLTHELEIHLLGKHLVESALAKLVGDSNENREKRERDGMIEKKERPEPVSPR